ncbi:Arc-like DNA binding domain-containing protein [Burkholderia diffusa]|uniref:Arc family DNA-binding protein n=1 Tax=Burkholderia diffusa TaxID=488732 RepID=UPI001CAEEC4F|nr:Arc family DNA-binding protein [Burkholderia diffusa]CAG9264399.1 Arc-like DNA binding domain-containing protein [Burkholderia diffusa]
MKDIYRSQYRLPWPLYEQLKESADQNRRSLNAEIVERLWSSYAYSNTDLGRLREAIAKMSLSDVMTADELSKLAERVLQLVNTAHGNDTTPTP